MSPNTTTATDRVRAPHSAEHIRNTAQKSTGNATAAAAAQANTAHGTASNMAGVQSHTHVNCSVATFDALSRAHTHRGEKLSTAVPAAARVLRCLRPSTGASTT